MRTPEGECLFLVPFAETVLGAEGTELWMIPPVSSSPAKLGILKTIYLFCPQDSNCTYGVCFVDSKRSPNFKSQRHQWQAIKHSQKVPFLQRQKGAIFHAGLSAHLWSIDNRHALCLFYFFFSSNDREVFLS